MNIIVAEVEKRAKEAAQQLRDAGRDEMVEYAMKAQREHEAAGMRYAHATLKAVEIMENALNCTESKTTYQPNESPEAKQRKADEDARLEQRNKDIRDHLGLDEDDSLVQVHLSENIRYEFADEYEARSWGSVQVGGYIGYTDFKTGQFVAYKPNNDQGVEVDNTASGFKAGTTNDVWVRDDADADAIMQEIQQTLSDIADERRGQDDEYAKSDADTLYDTSDLVQRIREYVAGKADVTAQTTLDDVASAKPVQVVSEAVSTSDDTTDKIKVESIVIDRAEGLSEECIGPITVQDIDGNHWLAANVHLAGMALTAPKTGGYDKVDFTINFENGETYTGRYDLKHKDVERADLKAHVRDFVRFSAGVDCPSHMTEESWRGYLKAMEQYNPGIQDKFKDLYDNYDVGISG